MFRSLIVLVACFSGFDALAGSCDALEIFRAGSVQVRTLQDEKGKDEGKVTQTVKSATPAAATLETVVTDAKGKEQAKHELVATCQGTSVVFDMKSMVGSDVYETYRGWRVSADAGQLAYPIEPKVGKIADGKVIVTFTPDVGGVPPVTVTVGHTDRMIAAAESIAVPAGTFTAWKLTYNTTTETKSVMTVRAEHRVVEWFVPGVGSIRTETYKGDKLKSVMVLAEKR
jgi:hypothetical protein